MLSSVFYVIVSCLAFVALCVAMVALISCADGRKRRRNAKIGAGSFVAFVLLLAFLISKAGEYDARNVGTCGTGTVRVTYTDSDGDTAAVCEVHPYG